MIDRWEASIRRWRHRMSRNAWLVRMLKMPVAPGPPEQHGLLLIQIDGLARRHLDAALEKRRMPFLQRLLRHEHYQLRTMYSGVPSTTPAVQAELFYGIRQAVPAFAFRDANTGKKVEMFAAAVALRKQRELESQTDRALLSDGSAYCNIYTGGAAEPHYCAAALGWGQLTDGVRPWTWLVIALLYTPEIARAGLLMLLELVVALRDAALGFISRRHPLQELQFVLRRVLVAVVLRELATIAASLDAARGLPVVQVNFLGYDEQSHHRGPDAHYAHWSLGGIDNSIARIWQAAARSPYRDYDLWIYSDHGQERVTSYTDRFGCDVQQSVAEVIRNWSGDAASPARGQPAFRGARASYVRRTRSAAERLPDDEPATEEVQVIAVGPVGFIYYQGELSHRQWQEVAAALVEHAHVPLVLLAEADGRAQAWAPGRHGYLPDDAALFLGQDHPFLQDAAEDLARLAHHRDAGQLVIGGWAEGEQPLTYVLERGAHAGCGPDELSGFALLPFDAPLEDDAEPIRRPQVLRNAALRFRDQHLPRRRRFTESTTAVLRVMTYNIHSCVGMDGRVAPERVARVIAATGADVVALQEVDVGRRRTRFLHQAQRIAEALEMDCHFHCTFAVGEGQYGHAVVSRWPLRVIRSQPLPTLLPKSLEPRGALWVELDMDGQPVQLINTHLGLMHAERSQQLDILLGPEWLGSPECRDPIIFCGDFNAGPRSPVYRKLTQRLVDVQRGCPGHRPQNTFISRWPVRRIDHIFVGGPWQIEEVSVVRTELARRASDHLPLLAQLRLRPDENADEK